MACERGGRREEIELSWRVQVNREAFLSCQIHPKDQGTGAKRQKRASRDCAPSSSKFKGFKVE